MNVTWASRVGEGARLGVGGGGDGGQGASNPNCEKLPKIEGKLRCSTPTSRSRKGQHLCAGDTWGTNTHARGTGKRQLRKGRGTMRKIAVLNPPSPDVCDTRALPAEPREVRRGTQTAGGGGGFVLGGGPARHCPPWAVLRRGTRWRSGGGAYVFEPKAGLGVGLRRPDKPAAANGGGTWQEIAETRSREGHPTAAAPPRPVTGGPAATRGARRGPVTPSPGQLRSPPRDIPSGCCSFTGPWTVTRSPLRMLRRVAAFCRPLRPVLLLVSFPRSWSPVVGVLGLCWMWHGVPFACQRRPIVAPHTLVRSVWGPGACGMRKILRVVEGCGVFLVWRVVEGCDVCVGLCAQLKRCIPLRWGGHHSTPLRSTA